MKVYYATEDRLKMNTKDFRFRLFRDVPELNGKEVTEDFYIGPREVIHSDDLKRAGLVANTSPITPPAPRTQTQPEQPLKLTPAQKRAITIAAKKAAKVTTT